jgi:hypothetical protein
LLEHRFHSTRLQAGRMDVAKVIVAVARLKCLSLMRLCGGLKQIRRRQFCQCSDRILTHVID